MINIDELTVGQVKAIVSAFGQKQNQVTDEYPFELGKNYFIRTVTHHHTGKLVHVGQQELVLVDAAWIADDGRLTDALKSGTFNEVEMFPAGSKVIVGRGSIIDALIISTLPTSQK